MQIPTTTKSNQKRKKKEKKKMKPSDDKTSVGYSELCQTSRMKSFGKIGNYF